MSKSTIFETVTIIGLGLIGSSIARAIRKYNVASKIIAYDNSDFVRARVKELAIADMATDCLEKAVKDTDIVILCIPVGSYDKTLLLIASHLKEGTIVTDVGSVKGSVVKAAKKILPEYINFVAGHPIAGAETSGPDAGFASLFNNRWCILTPDKNSDENSISLVKQMWKAFGSNVEIMSPKRHDMVLAVTSHIPHLIAYNIIKTASDMEQIDETEVIKYSAGGFRDFTRIAASNPIMWRDIFLNNKEAVLEVLGRFSEDLFALQRAIRWDRADNLVELFEYSRKIRKSIIEAEQDTDKPNFGRR